MADEHPFQMSLRLPKTLGADGLNQARVFLVRCGEHLKVGHAAWGKDSMVSHRLERTRIPDGVTLTEVARRHDATLVAADQLTRTARRITGDDDLTVVASRKARAIDAEGRIKAVLVLTCYGADRSTGGRCTLSVVVPRHGGRAFAE